jgi:hypothetical protein
MQRFLSKICLCDSKAGRQRLLLFWWRGYWQRRSPMKTLHRNILRKKQGLTRLFKDWRASMGWSILTSKLHSPSWLASRFRKLHSPPVSWLRASWGSISHKNRELLLRNLLERDFSLTAPSSSSKTLFRWTLGRWIGLYKILKSGLELEPSPSQTKLKNISVNKNRRQKWAPKCTRL